MYLQIHTHCALGTRFKPVSLYQLLNPFSLELPSEFHKGEGDCSCNLNCKDRGKDDHDGCQKIERKKAKKRGITAASFF
jgi:hypothetical protein